MPSERDRLRSVYGELLTDDTLARWSSSNPGNVATLAERVRWTSELLSRHGRRAPSMALDLGSGGNTTLTPALDRPGATCRVGVDILFERLATATPQAAAGLVCADGAMLPFRSEAFDLVSLFTVFSSVGDPATCRAIAREVARVLRPGGAVLWYDVRYPNPSNPNLRPFRRKAVEQLFEGFEAEWRSLTVLPPVARHLGRLTRLAYPALAALPPLRSHLLGVLQKKPSG